jgi:hypothetical protein
VSRERFEHQVLELWMTTRIPLTRVNVQFCTGAPRNQVGKWLDQLVDEGVLEVDSDDEGEMIWMVRGAERSRTGTTSAAEYAKLGRMKSELAGSTALVKSMLGAKGAAGLLKRDDGGKSIIASGLLSFFFGPWGWLYAAPLKEAAPMIAIYMLVCAVLPHMLLLPLLGLAHPISALAGVAYAWRHNQKGERTPLLGEKKDDRLLPPKR